VVSYHDAATAAIHLKKNKQGVKIIDALFEEHGYYFSLKFAEMEEPSSVVMVTV